MEGAPRPRPSTMGKAQKKQQPYVIFCREKRQTVPALANKTLPELVELCPGMWQDLEPHNRQRYIDMAKGIKNRPEVVPAPRRSNGELARRFYFDDRSVLTERVKEERRKRFYGDVMRMDIDKRVRKAQESGVLMRMRFHIMTVNTWVGGDGGEEVLPAEVGLVVMTLKDGIVSRFSQMIHPGAIPLGHKADAMIHSENKHQIWLDNPELSRNYGKIVDRIRALLTVSDDGSESYAGKDAGATRLMKDQIIEPPFENLLSAAANGLLPVYVMPSERETVAKAMDWLRKRAGVDYEFAFYELHYLFWRLCCAAPLPLELPADMSLSVAEYNLKLDVFLYLDDVSCKFHESIANCFCAGGAAARLSFIISDFCCQMFGIRPLQGRHVPVGVDVRRVEDSIASNSSLAMGVDFYHRGSGDPAGVGGRFGKKWHIVVCLVGKVGHSAYEVKPFERVPVAEIPANIMNALADADLQPDRLVQCGRAEAPEAKRCLFPGPQDQSWTRDDDKSIWDDECSFYSALEYVTGPC